MSKTEHNRHVHPPANGLTSPRRFVGILFECCNVYARVYINAQRTAYVGWCPRCALRVEIAIDSRGTDSRFFRAVRC